MKYYLSSVFLYATQSLQFCIRERRREREREKENEKRKLVGGVLGDYNKESKKKSPLVLKVLR
jgi:hypothetical protein